MKTEVEPDNIIHEHYCQKRPEETGVRTERFDAPFYDETGVKVAGIKRVHRCLECGSATYDNVPEQHLRSGAGKQYLPSGQMHAVHGPASAPFLGRAS